MPHWTETVYRQNPGVFRHHIQEKLDVAAEETDDLLALLESEGIDISESYLDSAGERAAEREVSDYVTFEWGDMRKLSDRTVEFDLVSNLWTSFDYYDEATNRAVHPTSE